MLAVVYVGWREATSAFYRDTEHTNPDDHFEERLPQWWVGAPEQSAPPAYHVLMRAAINGDLSSFVSTDELKELWRIWTPLLSAYDSGQLNSQTHIYKVGSSRESWHETSDFDHDL